MLEEYIPFIGKKGGKLKSFFQHVYALLVVCVGFVFFRADTMKQGCFWIREMFTDFGWKASAMSLTLQQLTPVYLVTLAAAPVSYTHLDVYKRQIQRAAVPGEQQHIRSLPGIYCGMRELSFLRRFPELTGQYMQGGFFIWKTFRFTVISRRGRAGIST